MDCEVDKKRHYSDLGLSGFNRGLKGAEAARETCAEYGEGSMLERNAQNWLSKFRNWVLDLEDALRLGRPSDFNENRLIALLKES